MPIINAILEVFSGVGEWMSTAFDNIIPIFWKAAETGDGGALTFMGVLCIASLAIGVVFLLIGVVQNFLRFRS